MSSLMRVVMILAPWLARMAYACPYLIPAQAVAGAVVTHMSKVKPLRLARPERPHNQVTVAKPAQPPKSFLVNKDDAWRSIDTLSAEFIDGDISDSRLTQRTVNTRGDNEWEVEAPITFSYRVRETEDVFNPDSEALLFGHITDKSTLDVARARKLKRVVVVDSEVFALYGSRIEAYFAHHDVETRMLVLETTEENKNMDMCLTIADAIHDLGLDRRLDPVIAIGGGVCMDIVGFAASMYRRRTPYIRVPTTLMGYVDASIGAKSGVNFAGKKNKLGAYLPPSLALLDRRFLCTLDRRQLTNGAAEIAKMAMVKDPELFELLASHGPELIEHKFQDVPISITDLIETEFPDPEKLRVASAPSRVLTLAIQTMLEELAPNLWEDSLTRLVDFGHVFSMELEMAVLFDDKLFHGEAVAIDMAFCAVLSYVRGHIDSSTCDALLDMMRGLGLPVYHPLLDEAMLQFALHERVKFSSGQKIPLPTAIGVARIFDDITHEQIGEALAEWQQRCA